MCRAVAFGQNTQPGGGATGKRAGSLSGRILSIAEKSENDSFGDMKCTCADDQGGLWRVNNSTADEDIDVLAT